MNDLQGFIDHLFGPESRLATEISGYEPRPVQAHMARVVAETAEQESKLLVEAGTGTGKTLGYLLPLLAMGERVIVSTATKALQDQIWDVDIPLLRRVGVGNFRAAVLKGRSNYLCLHRFREFQDNPMLIGQDERNWFKRVKEWVLQTRVGDRDELADLPEQLSFWHEINAGGERCLGRKCGDYKECFLFKTREVARHSDLVVVNHHLFFADLAVKEGGFGEILPQYNVVVFDEAHRIPDVVTHFFGVEVSNYRLRDLVRDGREAFQEVGPDDTAVLDAFDRVELAAASLRSAFPAENIRDALTPEEIQKGPGRALVTVEGALYALKEALEPHRERSVALASCGRRAESLLVDAGIIRALDDPERVYWYETRNRGIFLQASPLEVGPTLRESLYPRAKCIVFTSATLAAGRGPKAFDYFQSEMGLLPNEVTREQLPPAFDYPNQALLYLPEDLPEPENRDFGQLVVAEIVALLEASSGRALCLFTSYRMLEIVRMGLEGRIPYPIMVQGERPKGALLAAFKSETASVLLGVGSFWEGVDVPGESLSLVIVDRLPFSSPADPLMAARLRHLKTKGGNPFMELSLPRAVLALKQGLGRLIRRGGDRGVMAVMDARLTRRRYGGIFLAGLPPVPTTRDREAVTRFFS
ncbi:MAG: ATP-dependent DNA helicase [Magnetococcales bacterium]|nr:ATP-dependent DNA helicase [Magnetococcales bacterium]